MIGILKNKRMVLAAFCFLIIWGTARHHFRFTVVRSDSMMPTYNRGDILLICRFWGQIQRDDVIQFRLPQSNDLHLKRVVGLPNEKVVGRLDGIEIQGFQSTDKIKYERLDDFYFESKGAKTFKMRADHLTQLLPDKDEMVPANAYFVMGDNRRNSRDSRTFESVFETQVVGRVCGW